MIPSSRRGRTSELVALRFRSRPRSLTACVSPQQGVGRPTLIREAVLGTAGVRATTHGRSPALLRRSEKTRRQAYALRHSHITAQLLAGLPVQLVAKLHDTSASQIEKHYAATIASHTDDLVREAMMQIDWPTEDVVVPAREATA